MTQQQTVVVACAANAAYALPLAVMLRSATENLAPDRKLSAWVVDDGLGETARRRIAESLPRRATLQWLPPNRIGFMGLPLWGRMPVTTYDKLTIAESLPPEVTKAIWLDCDMLVMADIAGLWDMPMRDTHALAVTDSLVPTLASRFGVGGLGEMGLDGSAPYFNAGMMVLDAVQWRSSSVAAMSLEYLQRFRNRVVFWDQEALNAVLAGRWTAIDPQWNWSANLDRLAENGLRWARGQQARIIHFNGNLKPWIVREASAIDASYYTVVDETAWRGWRPARTLTRSILGWYGSSPLRRMMYPAEQWGMHAVWRLTQRNA